MQSPRQKLRHSKFRNTGILFELLTKQITSDIISGKDTTEAKNILYRYFKENTELSNEWQLYTKLINEKIKDEHHAERFLSVITEARKKINTKKLARAKYDLIKEIKKSYPIEDMLKSPVRNYRVMASIYKLFEDCSSDESKFDVNEIYQAKNCIIEHIVDRPSQKPIDEEIDVYSKEPEDVRFLAYKLLIEKFNQKYAGRMDENQREILRQYIYDIANTNNFGAFVKGKAAIIKQSLLEATNKIKDSEVVKIKIKEVANQMDKINSTKFIKENHLTVLLLGYELLKEIKQNVK